MNIRDEAREPLREETAPDDGRCEVVAWFEAEADRQRAVRLRHLEAEIERVRAMSAAEYVREVGIRAVREAPSSVRSYLRVGDAPFCVDADVGNVGLRLRVSQGNREWTHVADPWQHRTTRGDQ